MVAKVGGKDSYFGDLLHRFWKVGGIDSGSTSRDTETAPRLCSVVCVVTRPSLPVSHRLAQCASVNALDGRTARNELSRLILCVTQATAVSRLIPRTKDLG